MTTNGCVHTEGDQTTIVLNLVKLTALMDLTRGDSEIGSDGPVDHNHVDHASSPIVGFDQIYSFDRNTLIGAIPRLEKTATGFEAAANELFDRVMQLTDNAGALDDHRALNYLAMRYPPAICATLAEAPGRNASLTGVEVRPSRLSSTRKLVGVIVSFTNRNDEVTEKYLVRVDVIEEFPFLVTKMSPLL